VIISARAEPPLMLARLRANGSLVELRASDLGFTPAEAAELLRGVLPARDVEAVAPALADRTEGWIAGLHLAALSLHDREDIEAFLRSFSGSHRFVMDYLMEEILLRQPDDVRAFLRGTAILDRLCADLCDAVTGRDDSQEVLEGLERANLFVIPLDDTRRWWRYHRLFAELLRWRLQQVEPERITELHHRAAAWHADHGLTDEAIRHALAAGEPAFASRLTEVRARGRTADLVEPLSERELEVLSLMAQGKANRQIASDLFVTLDTVKKHITHILGKLEAGNRTQAAARARSLGLVPEAQPMPSISTTNDTFG
jgi:LuxR family maltose regulon positive regulatory protein